MRGVTFDITARKVTERQLALLAEVSTTGLDPAVHGDRVAHRPANGGSDRRRLHHPRAGRRPAEGRRLRPPRPGGDAVHARRRRTIRPARTTARSMPTSSSSRARIVLDDVPAAEARRVEGQVPQELIERFRARSGVIAPLVSARTGIRHADRRARERPALYRGRADADRSHRGARGARCSTTPGSSTPRSARPRRRGDCAPKQRKPAA